MPTVAATPDSFSVHLELVDLSITKNGERFRYRLSPLAPDPNVALGAWRFTLVDSSGVPVPGREPYDVVRLHGGRLECDCLGFLRWQRCKHARVLSVLLSGVRPTTPDHERVVRDVLAAATST